MDIAIAGAGLKLGIEQTKKCKQKRTIVQLMLILGENETKHTKQNTKNLTWYEVN